MCYRLVQCGHTPFRDCRLMVLTVIGICKMLLTTRAITFNDVLQGSFNIIIRYILIRNLEHIHLIDQSRGNLFYSTF